MGSRPTIVNIYLFLQNHTIGSRPTIVNIYLFVQIIPWGQGQQLSTFTYLYKSYHGVKVNNCQHLPICTNHTVGSMPTIVNIYLFVQVISRCQGQQLSTFTYLYKSYHGVKANNCQHLPICTNHAMGSRPTIGLVLFFNINISA